MTNTAIAGYDFEIVHRGEPGHFTHGATILHHSLGGDRHLYVIEELTTDQDSEDVFTYVVMNTQMAEKYIHHLLTQTEDIDPVNVECTGYTLTRASLAIIVQALLAAYGTAVDILNTTTARTHVGALLEGN